VVQQRPGLPAWRARVACVALGLVALAGCSSATSPATLGTTPAPPLASVTPLGDPHAYEGASHAVVSTDALHPIATNPTSHLPVTVTDSQGTKVTVTSTDRILPIDLYGTLGRTVFELGLGSHVVGRDMTTQFREAAHLPLITHNGQDLNAEAILALKPTVVLTDTTLGPWDAILQIRAAGIPVVITDSRRSMDNVATITHQVAAALGVPAQGRALVKRQNRQIDAIRAEIAKVAPADEAKKLRMIFLYARGQAGVYYLFGEGSGADSLIDAVGGYDVAGEIGLSGMKPVTDEGLVAARPDLILMMSGSLTSMGGVEGVLKKFPALTHTQAGIHRRIVTMDDSQILAFGPLTANVLNALAVAIYAPEDAA